MGHSISVMMGLLQGLRELSRLRFNTVIWINVSFNTLPVDHASMQYSGYSASLLVI